MNIYLKLSAKKAVNPPLKEDKTQFIVLYIFSLACIHFCNILLLNDLLYFFVWYSFDQFDLYRSACRRLSLTKQNKIHIASTHYIFFSLSPWQAATFQFQPRSEDSVSKAVPLDWMIWPSVIISQQLSFEVLKLRAPGLSCQVFIRNSGKKSTKFTSYKVTSLRITGLN